MDQPRIQPVLFAVLAACALAAPAAAGPRGYLATPAELGEIATRADAGIEPHASNVAAILDEAERSWNFTLRRNETCSGADSPAWNDNGRGTKILVAKAFAYHLTGDAAYAGQVKDILEEIMSQVETISVDDQQCRLNFGWGAPELVIAADLIEDYWKGRTCRGPGSTRYDEALLADGPCKVRFQNWLIKNPYYVVSYAGRHSASNWGAAATNAMAHIADYLKDRPDAELVHRNPRQVNDGRNVTLSPAEAYAAANQIAIERMNGHRVEYGSKYSCSLFSSRSQDSRWDPVKSQITENGIIPEDARRDESCNIPKYDGSYQNYPQLHIGNNVQQCELMRRRGDTSCFDNVERTDVPAFEFEDRGGTRRTTHLRPGRGSLERAINAIIIDAGTEWRRTSALVVAYRYYASHSRLAGVESWAPYLSGGSKDCSQDICFGALTHGLASGEAGSATPSSEPPASDPEPPVSDPEPPPSEAGPPGRPGRPHVVDFQP
ncbi:MAG: hypothetical protein JRH16_12575 [Deltaproteobacteria bacterium]|nr:hypothetical protein [Deltaproteobacteria bacterium]MBW2360803.1 hypothetical protein [Deltaproteobacteria bacterium]